MKRPAPFKANKATSKKSSIPVHRVPDSDSEDQAEVARPEKVRVVSRFVGEDGTILRTVRFEDDEDPVYRPSSPPSNSFTDHRMDDSENDGIDWSSDDASNHVQSNDSPDVYDDDGYDLDPSFDDGYLSARLGRVTVEDDEEEEDDEGVNEADGADGEVPGDVNSSLPNQDNAPPKIKPLDEWRPLRDAVLLSMHLHDAPPSRRFCPGSPHTSDGRPPSMCTTPPTFRCRDCHDAPRCGECMLEAHWHGPFHVIENWNGVCWERSSLHAIGGAVHLGHDGLPCPTPLLPKKMNILHTNGFHECTVIGCGCDDGDERRLYRQLLRHRLFPATNISPRTAVTFACLRQCDLLMTQGKITGHDFYETLVRLTDNTGVDCPRCKYEEFMRVIRLWQHEQLLKRAGVAFLPGGIASAAQGSCAVLCPACPRPYVFELPKREGVGGDELEDEDPIDLFILPTGGVRVTNEGRVLIRIDSNVDEWFETEFVMVDANFRLRCKARGVEDLPLTDGLAYYVRYGPYKAYLATVGPQTEINVCDSGLHAVDHANTRGKAAYVVSGVGACQCRHQLVRPTGVGDLQKGERYANMDYIIASSLRGGKPGRLIVSYDIACQWSINAPSRLPLLPEDISFDPLDIQKYEVVIPKFHIAAHGKGCQTIYSLNYRACMARTDGENIERGWAWMNPAALSTREMGEGSRQDSLDNQWAAWNWHIVTSMGTSFAKRLDEACLEAVHHRSQHTTFTKTFQAAMIEEWSAMLVAWILDPGNAPNPFNEPEATITIADVRREVNDEEAAELTRGEMPRHSTSAGQLIVALLEAEEQQRVISGLRAAINSNKVNTRSLSVDDKDAALQRKIAILRPIQKIYMPGLAALLDEETNDEGDNPVEPRSSADEPLYLPSTIPSQRRDAVCSPGLVAKETRFRLAQAEDALLNMRKHLRVKDRVADFKRLHTAGTGQKANTRMRSLEARYEAIIQRDASRYRAARRALVALDPAGDWKQKFLVLDKKDVRPIGKQEGESEGRRDTSWIWLNDATQDTDANRESRIELNEGLRAEWAMSRSRAERWEEEREFTRAEMCRVLINFKARARWWQMLVGRRIVKDEGIRTGMAAYAQKQARILEAMCINFASLWLQVFADNGLLTPDAWPDDLREVPLPKRRIIPRRHRTKVRQRAANIAAQQNESTPPQQLDNIIMEH